MLDPVSPGPLEQASLPLVAGRRPGWQRQLLRYLVVGGLSVLVDVGLLVLLHQGLKVPLDVATTVAFGASLVVNFALNRMAMSSPGSLGMTRHLLRYVALVAANYVVTLLVVTSAARAGGSYLLAKLGVVAASTGWNFLLYRHWVFTPPPPRASTKPNNDRQHPESAPVSGIPAITAAGAGQRLLVVIPAFNEEGSVGQVIREVATCLPEAGVLVVDDASLDRTRERALEHGAMVLTLPFNLGVGGAMRAGFRFGLRNGFGPVLQIDGDGQHDPGEAHLLISALERADVVIGARFAGKGTYQVRGPRRWAMRVLSATLSRIAGTELTDTTSGFRVSSPRAVQLFAQQYPAEYLGDTVESTVLAARAGMVIRQVPVRMRVRAAGQPSQTSWRATLYLLRACLALCFAGMRWRTLPTTHTEPSKVAEAPGALIDREPA